MFFTSLTNAPKLQTNSTLLTHLLRRKCSTLTTIKANPVEANPVEANPVEERSAVETHSVGTKYKDGRSIPFLILPHSVKKAYHLNVSSITLPKVLDKYKWVTKTISTPQLPEHYSHTPTEIRYNELLKEFCDSLFHTVAFVKAFKNQSNPRYIPERINFSLISNILRLTTAFGGGREAVHLHAENSYLHHEPLLETHWPRNYAFYRTKFRPDFVLRTRNGLDVVEKSKAVTREEVRLIPGPYDAYAMNTYRQHIVHLRNQPACDNYNYNPIKHPHTTVMHNNRMRDDDHFLATGVMTMFSQLSAHAQAAGNLHGTEVKEPLVTQCVVTDGHRVVFMVYQLNTLSMLDDRGVWNRCWYSPVMEMFERRRSPHVYMVYEDAETGDELGGFNEECFRLFVNFIRKESV